MQNRVDKFLPLAFQAIKKVKVSNNTFVQSDGSIPKEYKGYISSLGANIVQAGVKAALTFYEAEESGSKSDRRLINAAIKFIIHPPDTIPEIYDDSKLTQLLTGDIQQKALEILDAATALKLALRTYKMS
jgi:CRISPR-associated protein Cmr5